MLLDTQIFFWTIMENHRLPARARKLMMEADQIYVSAATIWEMAIKIGLGKLDGDPRYLAEAITASNFLELSVTAKHGVAVHSLEMHHKDPFDRLLVAQALAEGLQLLTSDALLARYSKQIILV